MSHSSLNNAYIGERADIIELMPSHPKNVLDVGCSIGTLGQSIKNHFNCRVTGIEYCPNMAQLAQDKLDCVIQGDLNHIDLNSHLGGQSFDVIICGDVLEHLIDPWSLLSELTKHLAPQGKIIASIPNIRHWNSIWHLAIKGYWPYRDRGIHDQTHLRFFTQKNIRELFEQANLTIQTFNANYRLIEHPHRYNRWAHYFAWPLLKHFLAFQYLVCATLKDTQSP